MALINLDKDARKRLYRSVKIEDLRDVIGLNKSCRNFVMRETGVRYNKVDKAKLTASVEKAIEQGKGNEIMIAISVAFMKNTSDIFEHAKELRERFDEKTYAELTDDDHEIIEKYREEYNELENTPLTYDEFILYCCKFDEDEIEKLQEQQKEENYKQVIQENQNLNNQITGLKKDIDDAEKSNRKLNKTIQEQNEKIERINKDNEELKKQIKDYKKQLSIENLVFHIQDILPDVAGTVDIDDLLEQLTSKEKEFFKQNNILAMKKVLAAKYAIMIIIEENMEGDNHE